MKKTRLLYAAFVLGLVLLIYPSAADYWNLIHQKRTIMNYSKQVSSMDREEYAEQIRAAAEYNRRMSVGRLRPVLNEEEMAEYESQLSFSDSGIMGYIDIPKIRLTLPVCHGIEEEELKTAIGHIPETSLPVGGENSHCVLSGHRGLPGARLFSDLDKLSEGDIFTISVLNETFSYEVERIRVVLPKDMSGLRLEKGKDLCTLVTCTPYGVNTHRLLVRGHRVKNADGEAEVVADALQLEPAVVVPFLMAPVLMVMLTWLFAVTHKKDHSKSDSLPLLMRGIRAKTN